MSHSREQRQVEFKENLPIFAYRQIALNPWHPRACPNGLYYNRFIFRVMTWSASLRFYSSHFSSLSIQVRLIYAIFQ